jgi:uncharacterized iron-regulated protein
MLGTAGQSQDRPWIIHHCFADNPAWGQGAVRKIRTHIMLALSGLVLAACGATVAAVKVPPQACVPPGQWVRLEPSGPRQEAVDATLTWLAQQQVVLLGETHDDVEHHRWQLHTIAALHALRPRMVLGFEMLPRRAQPVLDDWVAGRLTDQEFLRRTEWERVWGYDAGLYLPIFHFARMQRIPMIALNVDRDLTRRVGERGWASVPAKEREGISDPAPASREYLAWLYPSYRSHQPHGAPPSAEAGAPPTEEELNAPAFRRFVEAQLVWDRAMAQALAERLRRDPGVLLVAIMGSGHVRHGFGVPRQLHDLGVTAAATALPWDATDRCDGLTTGLADAVFGVTPRPEPPAPPQPRLGIVFDRVQEGVVVKQVLAGSVAEAAGLKPGDLITQMAGVAVADTTGIVALVRRLAPGTWLPIQVRRGVETLEIVAKFPPHP